MLLHVARNALGPIATPTQPFLPVMLAGTVITETVFNYPRHGPPVLERGGLARLSDGTRRDPDRGRFGDGGRLARGRTLRTACSTRGSAPVSVGRR